MPKQATREFEMLTSHRKANEPEAVAVAPTGIPVSTLIVQDVIQKEVYKPKHLIEQEQEQMTAIERRIAEQNKRVNPFKKSAVVSTTWEVRESKRNRQRGK